MRAARLENTNQALKFLIADGVRLVNIDAQNIVDGGLKLVLGLLWTLILKGQISQNKADASKKVLLEWVNSNVVEHKVTNFSSDLNGGNTLCELISKLESDFIDMYEANGKPGGDHRIACGENISQKVNTPSIIDLKEMAVDEPDELSVIAYVSFCRYYETERPKALFEEDELDFFASEQLSLFPAILVADNVTLISPLFRFLLNHPETSIRDEAVNSFSGIITLFAAVDHTDFLLFLAPLSIFSKVSCCKLLHFFPPSPRPSHSSPTSPTTPRPSSATSSPLSTTASRRRTCPSPTASPPPPSTPSASPSATPSPHSASAWRTGATPSTWPATLAGSCAMSSRRTSARSATICPTASCRRTSRR